MSTSPKNAKKLLQDKIVKNQREKEEHPKNPPLSTPSPTSEEPVKKVLAGVANEGEEADMSLAERLPEKPQPKDISTSRPTPLVPQLDLSCLPDTPKKTQEMIASLMQKTIALSLKRLEKQLTYLGDDGVSITTLISGIKDLAELQIVLRWTEKLEEQILSGKVKLPAGVKGMPALSKLQRLAKEAGDAEKKEQGSGDPEWMGDMPAEDVPA